MPLRAADLIDTSGATNIAGTKFDSPSNPAAPKGVLDSSITPLHINRSSSTSTQLNSLASGCTMVAFWIRG